MKLLIVEPDGFSPNAGERLSKHFAVSTMQDHDYSDLLMAVAETDVLWVRLRHYIGAELMNAAPRLKLIVTNTTGLNHIDLEEAARRGVHVLSLRGETDFLNEVRATAELTLGLVLSLLRKVPQAAAHVLEGGWNRNLFKGREVFGKTVGVVGYGRLGRIVSAYFQALGARVVAADPCLRKEQTGLDVELLTLFDLLSVSEIVTVHVSLSRDTLGMFGSEQFYAMRSGAWFVNTSRGELVDENALLDALVSGHLAGAALDVLSGESAAGMGSNPLVTYAREHDNLLITPHIGGLTAESLEKTEDFLAVRLIDFLATKGPL